MSRERPGTQNYDREAPHLLKLYEETAFEDAHRDLLDLIPVRPTDVLDIGAGTGRDAAWFAARGNHVTALEPTAAMREGARKLHPSPRIVWLDDGLPELASVQGRTFNLVWLSAVWMHFDATERANLFPTIAALVTPGGALMISLRHGEIPAGRRMFEVSAEETIALAEAANMECTRSVRVESLRQHDVYWSRLWFRTPET